MRHISLVSIVIALQAGPGLCWLHAQESDPGSRQEETITESEEPADRAADIRDAINDDLVAPIQKDKEAEDPTQDEPSAKPEEPSPDEPAVPPEEEHWYHHFESVTESVQSLPERVPGLQGRGWLHFGRVEGEYGYFTGGILEDESGLNLRSLRGGLIRQVSDRTTLKFELDVTDGDSNFVDLWARFKTRFGIFTVGNQRVAQTLVNQTSRLSRTFQEVPLPADAFGLGRRLGAGWDLHYKKVGVHLTAFGQDLNDSIGKFGYGARFYLNPSKTVFNMFHVGLSAVQEKMDRDARFRAYPETRVTDIRLVDTGRQSEVDQQSIAGVEMAWARKSYSFRSEYFVAAWDRSKQKDTRFDGFYIQANWAITGEPFKYAQGKFLRIRPENPYGAFEVAIRYSYLDLNDQDIFGGEQRNSSIALNWYGPGNQLRIQSSLIHYNTDEAAGNEDDYVVQLRVQLHW